MKKNKFWWTFILIIIVVFVLFFLVNSMFFSAPFFRYEGEQLDWTELNQKTKTNYDVNLQMILQGKYYSIDGAYDANKEQISLESIEEENVSYSINIYQMFVSFIEGQSNYSKSLTTVTLNEEQNNQLRSMLSYFVEEPVAQEYKCIYEFSGNSIYHVKCSALSSNDTIDLYFESF